MILGCPHASITQLKKYSELLSGRRVKNNVEIWIQTSNIIKNYAKDLGFANVIESSGAKIVKNTCQVCMPQDYFKKRGYTGVATDSAKMVYYVTTTKNLPCYCGSLNEIIGIVTSKI